MTTPSNRTANKNQNKTAYDRSLTPPCQVACPLHMNVREYVDSVAQGKIMEAMQIIRSGNPFPSICAYICSHPCEENCRRSQVDKPVAIRALKRFAVEFGGDRMVQAEAQTTRNEKIAVVGSGPAGMSCAYYLRKLGYPVTIFEAHSRAGGMLRTGIPHYRLSQEVIEGEITRLVKMGVEFRTDSPVVSLDLLFEFGYKAVFVTIGAQQGRRLGVEGEDKLGVVDAVTFLREVNLGIKPSLGTQVVVVGGGNVAIDAARSSLRLGAKKVNLVCLESRDEMPAFKADIDDAISEGVVLNCSWGIKRVSGSERATGVECMKCTSVFDSQKKFNPSYDQSVTTILEAETVIVAIGQVPKIPEDFHLRIGRGSTIQVDPVTLTTNRAGVFAGGDAVTGPGTAVQALAAGRLAANRIDDYIQHRYPGSTEESKSSVSDNLSTKTIEVINKIKRQEPPVIAPETRTENFNPVELVYNWESAVDEARRCLRCGVGAEILFQDKCASCLTCVRVCPYHVPFVDDAGTVVIPSDQCLACGVCVAECPAKAIVLRKPVDRRQINDELQHVAKSIGESGKKPLLIGFCCQYGLFGTGSLTEIWKRIKAGIWVVPVLCVAKVEAEHLLQAFLIGAEGVFVAGCGKQCARENTEAWVQSRVNRVQATLLQIGLEPERLQYLRSDNPADEPASELNRFIDKIGKIHLDSVLKKEVKK